VRCFFRELFPARRRQPVIFRPPVVVRYAPLCREKSANFQPMQRRIQGAFFDTQDLVATLMEVFRDVVAVHLSVGQSFQDEHVECVAQQIAGFGLFLSHCKSVYP